MPGFIDERWGDKINFIAKNKRSTRTCVDGIAINYMYMYVRMCT